VDAGVEVHRRAREDAHGRGAVGRARGVRRRCAPAGTPRTRDRRRAAERITTPDQPDRVARDPSVSAVRLPVGCVFGPGDDALHFVFRRCRPGWKRSGRVTRARVLENDGAHISGHRRRVAGDASSRLGRLRVESVVSRCPGAFRRASRRRNRGARRGSQRALGPRCGGRVERELAERRHSAQSGRPSGATGRRELMAARVETSVARTRAAALRRRGQRVSSASRRETGTAATVTGIPAWLASARRDGARCRTPRQVDVAHDTRRPPCPRRAALDRRSQRAIIHLRVRRAGHQPGPSIAQRSCTWPDGGSTLALAIEPITRPFDAVVELPDRRATRTERCSSPRWRAGARRSRRTLLDDTRFMHRALEALGVRVGPTRLAVFAVDGVDGRFQPRKHLEIGNAEPRALPDGGGGAGRGSSWSTAPGDAQRPISPCSTASRPRRRRRERDGTAALRGRACAGMRAAARVRATSRAKY